MGLRVYGFKGLKVEGMGYNYAFEKLEVWQKSRKLVKQVYISTENFPSEEKYRLTRQIRRACISMISNIAEGSTRWSKKDKARFYEMAYGSLVELLNQLIISNDLEYLSNKDLTNLRKDIEQIGRMLNALFKSNKP